MKEFFKSLKPGLLLTGLVSVALGLVLIIIPDIVGTTLRFVLGGGLTVFGILEIVSVFVRPNGILSVGRMIPGILSLAVGLVFLFKAATFLELLWTMVGIAVLIDSVYKLQYAFELKAARIATWWINLLVSLFAMVFAAVLMIEPFGVQNAMATLTGALLLANGIFDLISLGLMSANAKRLALIATVTVSDVEEEKAVVKK